jgi:hypothetical protein
MSQDPQSEESMSQDPQFSGGQGGSSMLRNVALGIASLYVVFSLYLTYQLNGRLSTVEQKQAKAEQALRESQEQFRAASDTLAERVGMTRKELGARASALQRQQKLAESRLAEEAKKQQDAIAGELTGVKSDVGGVKSEAATIRSELEATKAKLERTIGDLGIQSGLIATTRDQLDLLKQRGERNYFEFTLAKNARPTPVSTIGLQLKKADRKKGKFTLNVVSDDKTIEKKDKYLNEPVQFYTGRDRSLYELVIFAVDKDKVSGYLSTPKIAQASLTQ